MELCTALVMMAGMSSAIVFSLADKGSHILVTSRERFAAWRGAGWACCWFSSPPSLVGSSVGASARGGDVGDSVIRIGEVWATSSPIGTTSAAEALEGGPPPADTYGVEALGGSSKKLSSAASTAGGAVANGMAWIGEAGACGGGDDGGGIGVDGGVDVGRGGGAGGEEGATLFLFVTRPSSVTSSSSSSSSWTTWGAFLMAFHVFFLNQSSKMDAEAMGE